MKIYTKTGDAGTTAVFGGTRVSKYDLQVEAYGSVDEVTSILGWILASDVSEEDTACITRIQNDLYMIMSALSGSTIDLSPLASSIEQVEQRIDTIDAALPELRHFILPQGGETAARFHIGRSATRRAERVISHLFSNEKHDTVGTAKTRSLIAQYMNRLSDLLFVFARRYAHEEIAAHV